MAAGDELAVVIFFVLLGTGFKWGVSDFCFLQVSLEVTSDRNSVRIGRTQ